MMLSFRHNTYGLARHAVKQISEAVEKRPPAELVLSTVEGLRSIASLQRISKCASAHRFLAGLASGPF
jgi:hypothetical protein